MAEKGNERTARQSAHQASRETCRSCWRPNPVGFVVPDSAWFASVPAQLSQSVLCIVCFATLADEHGVDWDRDIEFFPVSRISAVAADTHDRKDTNG